METELRHRSVPQPQTNGLASNPVHKPLIVDGDTHAAKLQGFRPPKPKHGREMQIFRGVSLFLYFFLSCIA